MNRFYLIFILVILITPAYPQYLGGIEDGFSVLASGNGTMNDQDFYCTGGSEDGFCMLNTENQTLNDQVFYCSGGNSDGSDRIGVSGYFYNPAYCFGGGINDGFSPISTGNTHFFNQVFYLSGGINDGFSILNTGPTYICDPSIYVSGGINDGFAVLSPGLTYICDPSIYASGGSGDGFHKLAFSGSIYLSPAWLGGIADGFSILQSPVIAFTPTFFCLGGDNDGAFSLHMPVSYFGKGIWLGTMSSSWDEPSNWSLNYIPDLTVNVLIPAGRAFYPLITTGNLSVNFSSGSQNCLSLTIREGGSLFNKTNLDIDGTVTISGLYQADGNANSQVFVNSGGNLILVAPGQMIIGNP
jgi:hypothetical protein